VSGSAVDHPIIRSEACRHLDAITEIATEPDRLEHHLAAVGENRNLCTTFGWYQRCGRCADVSRVAIEVGPGACFQVKL